MKVLTALFVLLAVGLAGLVLVPLVGVGLVFAVPALCFFIWILPILIIACSDRTTGGEKLAWILAIIFLSWFAWIFYFLLAPLKPNPEQMPYPDYRPYRY